MNVVWQVALWLGAAGFVIGGALLIGLVCYDWTVIPWMRRRVRAYDARRRRLT